MSLLEQAVLSGCTAVVVSRTDPSLKALAENKVCDNLSSRSGEGPARPYEVLSFAIRIAQNRRDGKYWQNHDEGYALYPD